MLFAILTHEFAFLDQPLHFTVQLLEDLIHERDTGEDTRGFGEEASSCWCGAYDETTIVEGGCVFGEPGANYTGPGWREQVCWVAMGRCAGCDWHVGGSVWLWCKTWYGDKVLLVDCHKSSTSTESMTKSRAVFWRQAGMRGVVSSRLRPCRL